MIHRNLVVALCCWFWWLTPWVANAAAPLVPAAPGGAPSEAEEVFHPQGTPLRKLERGGANALLGGLEFFYRMRRPDNGSILPPWVSGIGSSIYYTCKRSLAGLYDIVTFPLPLPADYASPMEPEFVWQYPPKKIFRKK